MNVDTIGDSSDLPRSSSRYRLFVAISPGLEVLLEQELREFGIEGRSTPGGVECSGPIEQLWTVHHHSRLAESVRLRLRPFQARSFAELERELERLPWHGYLRSGDDYRVSVSCQASKLFHTDAIAERVRRVVDRRIAASSKSLIKDGISCTASRGQRETSATIPVTSGDPSEHIARKLLVRVHRNTVQVSVDASGERLHRRGYRLHVGAAPLRETLAAAAVRLLEQASPGNCVSELWDPCCGSGTLLAEWLLLHRGRTIQEDRKFAFECWPIHNRQAYSEWCRRQRVDAPCSENLRAWGSDTDSRCIDASHYNLQRAGLAAHCELMCDDFCRAVARVPHGAAVLSNLPYGIRLADRDYARRLFLHLDRLLAERIDLRPVVLLTTFAPPRAGKCDWKSLAMFANGGLRVTAWGLAVAGAPNLPR